jgi:hypothetical protein
MDRAARDYPPGDLRVSDADRDRTLCDLTEAFQAGRITADELEQRSGQVLGARTGKELTAPLADLPLDPVPAATAAALERDHRVLAATISFAAAVGAIFLAVVAVGQRRPKPWPHPSAMGVRTEIRSPPGHPASPWVPTQSGLRLGRAR